MSKKAKAEQVPNKDIEFQRFEVLAKNLVSVSNKEVREKMEEEKHKKKANRSKS
ncbi:MAG TPA: hypothetical protein VF544_24200 [Pyrinomonadaceae bacterium]